MRLWKMLDLIIECLEVETTIPRWAPTASAAAGDSRRGETSEGLHSQGFLPKPDKPRPIIPITPISTSTFTEYQLIEGL